MANLDTLFEKWLDDQALSETEMAALQGNSDYREMMAAAEQWRARARQYQEQTVPRHAAVNLPAAAKTSYTMVAGWLVVALGVTGLWLQNQGLQQQIQQQQLQASKQQRSIQLMLEQLQQSRSLERDALAQLATKVVEQNRKERNLAIANVVDLIQAQRAQDQALLQLQLDEITQQVEQTPSPRLAQYRGKP